MKALKATWLITSNDDQNIIHDGAVVFDETIIAVGTATQLQEQYPALQFECLGENSVLMPGLINAHVHMEFSSNTTTLKYGNFMQWLHSVIASREELIEKATPELIDEKLKGMLQSGTTTIGAISSYSHDLNSCVKSPMNTVFFAEAIGSKMDMVDTLFADFKSRLNEAKTKASKSFVPAVAIHSPYSVHPFLVREVLKLAKEESLPVSAHFLESSEEFEWLHKDQGGFVEFFKNFLGQEKAVTKPMEFLNQFNNIKALSFTHCVQASNNDLDKIRTLGAVINHCPTSNRLLTNSKLDLNRLGDMDFSVGTDGLSSNNSLNMFDELRNALMVHEEHNTNELSAMLLKAATKNGATALGLNKGVLKESFDSDMIVLQLPHGIEEETSLASHVILHTKQAQKVIIGGNNVQIS